MTKLFHVDFEHTISFDDGSSTVLVLEDTKQFRKYITELYSSFEGNGPFHLVDGIKEKKFKDHLEIILSPFSASFSIRSPIKCSPPPLCSHLCARAGAASGSS